MNQKVLRAAAILTALVALLAGFLYLTRKPTLHGAVIDPPMAAADFQLTDFNGAQFTLAEVRGKAAILYFGYTHCADECPLSMAHLKFAVDMLAEQGPNVRVIMITTDPARDTPEAMREFLGKFNKNFVGLVGTPEQLGVVWHDYGVAVENGGETHSNYVYVLDAAGNLRETFLPDSLPADEAADLRLLLNE